MTVELLSSIDAIADSHYPLFLVLAVGCLALPDPEDIEKYEYTSLILVYLSSYPGLLRFLAVRALPSMRRRPSRMVVPALQQRRMYTTVRTTQESKPL